jgi:hypothetical protein
MVTKRRRMAARLAAWVAVKGVLRSDGKMSASGEEGGGEGDEVAAREAGEEEFLPPGLRKKIRVLGVLASDSLSTMTMTCWELVQRPSSPRPQSTSPQVHRDGSAP